MTDAPDLARHERELARRGEDGADLYETVRARGGLVPWEASVS